MGRDRSAPFLFRPLLFLISGLAKFKDGAGNLFGIPLS